MLTIILQKLNLNHFFKEFSLMIETFMINQPMTRLKNMMKSEKLQQAQEMITRQGAC